MVQDLLATQAAILSTSTANAALAQAFEPALSWGHAAAATAAAAVTATAMADDESWDGESLAMLVVRGFVNGAQNFNGNKNFNGTQFNNNFFTNAGSNSTAALAKELQFSGAKSVRMSSIILSVFNVLAASATALGIIYDNYSSKKRNDPTFRFR
jgi:hypothetical protein